MSTDVFLPAAKLHAALVGWVTDDTHRGVFATDTRFRILVWNRWMEIHSGRTAGEVVGRSVFELYPEVEERGIREYYVAAAEGRVTILSHGLHRFIIPLPPTNPDLGFPEMPQSGQISPLYADAGLVGILTVIEDVSDRLGSEAELRKQIEAQQLARAMAENALRAKDEFLSTLSHEIRTPLNAVLGWVRILLDRPDVGVEMLNRALHVIERNAAAQARMIDDLLDMARIVAGKLRLEMQLVDMPGVVLAAVDVVMPAAQARQITVRPSVDPQTPRVLGDQDRLQQVVWNLLSNALKFTDTGGVIDVRVEAVRTVVRIVVADTGRGIPAEFLPYVFERFRQHDASSARRHGGLGLGLALVRELIELHGGSVRVESAGVGRGATFIIELPTAASPDARRTQGEDPAAQAGSHPSLAGVHVILVEDEADASDLVRAALERCGAEVTAAASSGEAIEWLQQRLPGQHPDLLVSDIGMPNEDGYDLIRKVRALAPDPVGGIPAVAVTGYATPEDVARALAAGYQVHVRKPIDPASLVGVVAGLLRRGDSGDGQF